MTGRPILSPGPSHPITIARNPGRVIVKLDGAVIADSGDALTLREANYPAVHYIPRKDVDMSRLARSAHSSYCPYKGDASYFSAGGARMENAVWSYEAPYVAVAGIAGHLAFYADRFEIVETPAR